MKRLIAIVSLHILSFNAFAQTETDGIIRFMGIPVDGTRRNFAQQLTRKGFKYQRKHDCYLGIFNGKESNVFIHENHGVVDRIMVANADDLGRVRIKNEFNILLEQFKRNDKYISLGGNEPIPIDEDVAYEMQINNKQYGATFYLNPVTPDNRDQIREDISSQVALELAVSGREEPSSSEFAQLFAETAAKRLREMSTGQVWFMIGESGGLYYISIFYDNMLNRPHGEDL